MGILEAECQKCLQTFNPADENDLIHIETAGGNPCGGLGIITGEWISPAHGIWVLGDGKIDG